MCQSCRGRKSGTPLIKEGGGGGEHSFSVFVGVCFTINYVMGAGFLSLPDGFVASGVILGPILLILFILVCNLTKDMLLDTMARAENLASLTEAAEKGTGGDSINGETDHEVKGTSGGQNLQSLSKLRAFVNAPVPNRRELVVGNRKFEIPDLFEMFLGLAAKRIYVVLLSIYFLGTLWAYSSVFAASAAGNIPLPGINGSKVCDVSVDKSGGCTLLYDVYLIIFACIVVPLTCLELKEQMCVQVTMSAARVLVVVLMVFTVIFSPICKHQVFTKEALPEEWPAPTLFDFSGLQKMLPLAVYASIFHHSIPVLAHPVKHKTRLSRMFGYAFVVVGVAYIFIGLVLGLYFGHRVGTQCNIIYEHYLGCAPLGSNSRRWWAHVIGFIVLIFPALDIMSAYPLNAITLGNNLQTIFAPRSMRTTPTESPPSPSPLPMDDMPETSHSAERPSVTRYSPLMNNKATLSSGEESDENLASDLESLMPDAGLQDGPRRKCCSCCTREKWRRNRVRIMFRLIASGPPIIGAFIVSNLGDILQFTGIIGILIALVIPPVLWKASQATFTSIYTMDYNQDEAKLPRTCDDGITRMTTVSLVAKGKVRRFSERWCCHICVRPTKYVRSKTLGEKLKPSEDLLRSGQSFSDVKSSVADLEGRESRGKLNIFGKTLYTPVCARFPASEILVVGAIIISFYVFITAIINLATPKH